MGKKDDEQSVSSEGKGPLKTFQSLMGEGEKFARDTQYVKAVQSYTEVSRLCCQGSKIVNKQTFSIRHSIFYRSMKTSPVKKISTIV